MRTRQLSAAVGLVAALGLTLTACGSDAANTAAAKPSAPATTVPSGQASAPASAPAGAPESSPASAKASPEGGGGGGGSRKCTAADLKAAIAFGTGAQTPDGPGAEEIELTNQSKSVCTMKGYPGVDLVGSKGTWNLTRFQGVQPEQVTLQPGGKAYVTINYLPFAGDGGAEFKVQKIVLTPPDDTHQLTVEWSGASPQDQSGATHPGTYVRPVIAAR
ncbi:DUF4232 domain-containing protein [Kitasatospora sp. NPDC048407]|uniref:DUF4232 domain-containing protein n=1 Tax=Kitasatospora sp. NPDC048407 TaxID=3364051 RepID=UPI003720E19A